MLFGSVIALILLPMHPEIFPKLVALAYMWCLFASGTERIGFGCSGGLAIVQPRQLNKTTPTAATYCCDDIGKNIVRVESSGEMMLIEGYFG